MSKGQNVPEGVSYHSYRPQSSKGAKHPSGVAAGQPAASKVSGGSKGGEKKQAGGSAGGVPAGVKQASGTESLGSNPKTKQAAMRGPKVSMQHEAQPGGVRGFGGKSVKKK